MVYPFTPTDRNTTKDPHSPPKTEPNLTLIEDHENLNSTPYQHSIKPPAPSTPEKDTLS